MRQVPKDDMDAVALLRARFPHRLERLTDAEVLAGYRGYPRFLAVDRLAGYVCRMVGMLPARY